MKAGNNEDTIALVAKENAVGENPQFRAFNVLQNARKLLGMCSYALQLMFKLVDEAVTKSRTFPLIPVSRLDDLDFGSVEEPDFTHYDAREANLALN